MICYPSRKTSKIVKTCHLGGMHKYICHMGFLEFLKGHHGLFRCQECDTIH